MNMKNMMAQAQKMQKDIMKKQSEIDAKVFLHESEFITMKMNGKRELLDFNINSDLIKDSDDVEVLEDMIKVGFKDILSKIDKEIESKMGMYGSGLSGLI